MSHYIDFRDEGCCVKNSSDWLLNQQRLNLLCIALISRHKSQLGCPIVWLSSKTKKKRILIVVKYKYTWDQLKDNTIEWISKMWSIHTIEHYSVIKGMKYWHTTTWRNLKNIMLSERNQTQKATCYMTWFHSIWNIQDKQSHRDRK